MGAFGGINVAKDKGLGSTPDEEAIPFDEALRRLLAAKPKVKKAEDKPPPGEPTAEPEKDISSL